MVEETSVCHVHLAKVEEVVAREGMGQAKGARSADPDMIPEGSTEDSHVLDDQPRHGWPVFCVEPDGPSLQHVV